MSPTGLNKTLSQDKNKRKTSRLTEQKQNDFVGAFYVCIIFFFFLRKTMTPRKTQQNGRLNEKDIREL